MSSVPNIGSATTATFVTALTFNAAVFGIEIVAFTLLRPHFKAVYEPRSVTPVSDERVNAFTTGLLTWPIALFKADYKDVQRVNGSDAYFFVRFLRVMTRIFVPIWITSWIILLPVTSVNNSVPGNTGLTRFTFGNIAPENSGRYAAFIILVWLSTLWIFWNIRHEMRHFVTIRQLHLIDPVHSRSVRANTVLIIGIPSNYLSKQALTQLYSHLPGGVKKVWINRDLKQLPDIYDRRLAACGKLELAETRLLSTAAKIHANALKTQSDNGAYPQQSDNQLEGNIALSERLVPRAKRPAHRLPLGFMPFSLPFVGHLVDTIQWCRSEIASTTVLLRQGRRTVFQESPLPFSDDANDRGSTKGKSDQPYPPKNSAFITFNQQISAHIAHRTLAHHAPYHMSERYLEVSPEDVLWGNLALNPYEKRVRLVISYAATAALIIFWAIPVAFVGFISNISALCIREKWLAWLCTIPKPVLGIIQGILPPVMLALLMMLLPIILRLFGRFEGIPTRTGLELSLMTRYFIFQVIHSFLIITLSSGIVAALPSILDNPSSIATLLARYLPEASTFFLTYIILQGLTISAGGFLAAVELILYYVKLFLRGSTPRSIYKIKFAPRSVAWGTLFPGITLIVVITLGYSMISPIINGFSVVTFFLFYELYKYVFLYQFTQPRFLDTGGLFYPKAIQHVFVGLYIQQLSLCALFFLARDQNNHPSAIAEGVLMIILIALTVGFHIIINDSYGPLISALPLSIADKTHSSDAAPVAEPSLTTDETHRDTLEPGAHEPSSSASHPHPSHSVGQEGDSTPQPPMQSTPTTASAPASTDQSQYDELYFAQHADGTVDYGFAHPALVKPQRVVWIPEDTLGLGREEVRANTEMGVLATTDGASMNERGSVQISAPPVDVNKF